MENFIYYTPTEVVFGRGGADQAGELVKQAGATKVLIHYGGQSAVKSGLINRTKAALDRAGVAHVELGGVVPNPHLDKVREGIALCREAGVDFILAVGGGSVIDSAKAIAYGLGEPDKDVWELFQHVREAKACLPVASILTIAAAGSEMSNSCVITNQDTGEKRAYNDDISRPKFTVMYPELTMTLPDYPTQSGCADIIMHTMERYFTGVDHPMELTDGLAEALMRTVMKYAQVLHQDPKNYEARAEVMWAGSLAHNGLTGCGTEGGDWTTHMLEHELGGMFDVTHGAGLAAVWSSWARYVYKDNLPRFVKYAVNVMGVTPGASDEETALKGIAAMEDFYRSIAMPTNLRELGIAPTEEQILQMAKSCAQATGGSKGAIKVLYEADMAAIYRMAL